MFKNKKKYIGVVSVLLIALIIGGKAQANYTEPGSESDPIITKSYVDKKLNEFKVYIDKQINNNTGDNSNVSSAEDKYIVLELVEGQQLIGDASSEIIVRSGKVRAIGSELGGISDLTDGKDLKTGDLVENNHHILIPRNDNRGVYIESENTFIMIKGNYNIK